MMANILLNILSLGLKPFYEKHLAYYRIIKEFRDKLPRQQNQARTISDEEKDLHPILSGLKYMHVVDLATHKVSVGEADIDRFYNQLNNFDYRFILFKKYYRKFTKNLNRFDPKATNKDFHLVMVQNIIKDDQLHPLKPFDILVYHLKWEYKLTSKIYIWFLKRKRKKTY
jgi:hypothetical protein